METTITIIALAFFVFILWLSYSLMRQNEQLRKDLKDAYKRLNEKK